MKTHNRTQKFNIQMNVIKEFKGKQQKNSFLNINKNLIEELYLKNDKILEANIYVHRIIANICLTLKERQFHPNNDNYSYQLELFDDEFFSVNNTGITFVMNAYDICKGGNYDNLKQALEFLTDYMKKWYSSVNLKGETITNYGGLISNPTYNKQTKRFKFFISAYWLEKLLKLGAYNQTYYNLFFNLKSSKHIIFWHWLTTLPENGTNVKLESLNKRFGLDYSTAREVKKNFLIPIKKKLDLYAHESFNVSVKGNIISIAKYKRKAEDFIQGNELNKTQFEILKKRYSLGYLKKRHNLTDKEIGRIESVLKYKPFDFLKSYELFISNVWKMKDKKATDFSGDEFFNELNKSIKEYYLTTTTGKKYPNNYLRI